MCRRGVWWVCIACAMYVCTGFCNGRRLTTTDRENVHTHTACCFNPPAHRWTLTHIRSLHPFVNEILSPPRVPARPFVHSTHYATHYALNVSEVLPHAVLPHTLWLRPPHSLRSASRLAPWLPSTRGTDEARPVTWCVSRGTQARRVQSRARIAWTRNQFENIWNQLTK